MKSLKADCKKKKLTGLLGLSIISIFIMVSCDLTNLGDEDVFRKVPVLKITSIKRDAGKIEFEVNASYPNGCGSFSHSEWTQRVTNIDVAVYGKQKDGATCTDAIITIKGKVELNEPVSGSYTYHFWQSDSSSLDTTLVFD
ncbi:MAG: hypothetical protein JEY94_04600 [Melioribacteraceae bacterium]|nr:hypothetical protein [Melioribacteraceae bacterium]